MFKIKIESSSICRKQELPKFLIEGHIISSEEGEEINGKKTKSSYYMLMTEEEYREQLLAKRGKKNNPLMFTFEEYE